MANACCGRRPITSSTCNKPHRDVRALPFELDQGEYVHEGESIPALSATASVDAEGRLHVSLINIDPKQARVVEIELKGYEAQGLRSGRILTADAMNAHNTFEHPDALAPQPFSDVAVSGGKLVARLPAKSLVALEF